MTYTNLLDFGSYILVFLAWMGAFATSMLLNKGFESYTTEKGKNLATKEDIARITDIVENVKAEITKNSAIAEQKRKLKYEACLEALSVIDASLAQQFAGAIPQPVSTQKAREVHTKLILSCDDVEIVKKFAEIYFGPKPGDFAAPLTDLLNDFRNRVRSELGFDHVSLPLDRDRAWIGIALGDPNAPTSRHLP